MIPARLHISNTPSAISSEHNGCANSHKSSGVPASKNHSLIFVIPLLGVLFLLLSIQPAHSQELAQVDPEEAGFSAERLDRLTQVMNEYVEQNRIAGAVVHVLRGGKQVYSESFGMRDIESGAPMERDAIFRIASQTKAIVSVGVMMLQEEGKLLISDPLGNYLPEFMETTVAVETNEGGYDIVPAESPVTIRQLLTHTSGIDYGYGPAADLWVEAGIQGWYFADRDEPIRETVRRMAELPFAEQPGERYIYGYSTDILGALIEEVSGQTLEEFLQSRILNPLKMTDTHFYLPDEKINRLATVYSATEENGLERAPDPGGRIGQGHYVAGPRVSFSGGAGLLSTANDYSRFLQMLLNGGSLDGVQILSPSTVDLMTTNHIGDTPFRDGQGIGLGLYVVEDPGARGVPGTAGEFGWGGAYLTTYWIDPAHDLVVTFFTQLIPARGLDVRDKARTGIYQAIVDEGP